MPRVHHRYFNQVEPGWFIARGNGGEHDWPNEDTDDTWLLSPSEWPVRIVDVRTRFGLAPILQKPTAPTPSVAPCVEQDTSTSASLWARKMKIADGTYKYFAVGGEDVGPDEPDYRWEDENRDGLRVLAVRREPCVHVGSPQSRVWRLLVFTHALCCIAGRVT